jgi:hypothetical protein
MEIYKVEIFKVEIFTQIQLESFNVTRQSLYVGGETIKNYNARIVSPFLIVIG